MAKSCPLPHSYGICPEEKLPCFLKLLTAELTHLKNGMETVGTVNDEALSALCGFPNLVLRFIWCKYGLAFEAQGMKAADFLWTLSHMNNYSVWLVLCLLWGEKKTTFETRCKRGVSILHDTLKEVCFLGFFNSFQSLLPCCF